MICPKCNKFVPDTNYRCPHCRKVLKEGIDPLVFRHEHIQQKQKKARQVALFLSAVIVVVIAVLVYIIFIKEGKDNTNPDNIKPTISKSSQTSSPPRNSNAAPSTKSSTDQIDKIDQDTSVSNENTVEAPSEEIPIKPGASESGEAGEPGESGENTDNTYDWVDKEDPVKLAKSHIPGEEIDIEKLLLPSQTTIFDFYSEYCPPCRKISPALAKLDNIRKDIAVVKININRKGVEGIDWSSPVARQYQLRSIPYFIIYDPSGYRTDEGDNAYQKVINLLKEEKIQ